MEDVYLTKRIVNMLLPLCGIAMAMLAWWAASRIVPDLPSPMRTWEESKIYILEPLTYRGDQLHASGFVHRLGTLDDALVWARELALMAPLTMTAHKRGLEALVDHPVDPTFAALREQCWDSDDALEGRRAFLEKRPPKFG